MTHYYTCGHKAEFDEADEYSNGSYALWIDATYDGFGNYAPTEAYGSLCNDCILVYGAVKCKLGGEPL